MSIYLSKEWERIKDQLLTAFLTDERYQLTDIDREVVEESQELIKKAYRYKVCHLVAVGLFASGRRERGLHLYTRRIHEFSGCAEVKPIAVAHESEVLGPSDPLISMATFHGGHDSSGNRSDEPYLIPPCPKCLRQLKQVSPDCLIIVDLDGRGRLAKIPLEACEFFVHPRRHNGEK